MKYKFQINQCTFGGCSDVVTDGHLKSYITQASIPMNATGSPNRIKLLEMGLWDDDEADQRNFKREIATRISCRLFQGHIFWMIEIELKGLKE